MLDSGIYIKQFLIEYKKIFHRNITSRYAKHYKNAILNHRILEIIYFSQIFLPP